MAGLEIKLTTNANDVRRAVRELGKRQLPFVIAAALTDTAKEARNDVQEQLPKAFKIRRRTIRNAITYQPASKRDYPKSRSIVGTRPWAEFLTLHATGGIKRGERGHRIAVPTRLVRRTSSGRIRKTQKPRRVRERKGFAPGELEEKHRIAVRRTKRAREQRGIFFHVVDRAKIPKRWHFAAQVRRTAVKTFPIAFRRRWKKALETSRPKP